MQGSSQQIKSRLEEWLKRNLKKLVCDKEVEKRLITLAFSTPLVKEYKGLLCQKGLKDLMPAFGVLLEKATLTKLPIIVENKKFFYYLHPLPTHSSPNRSKIHDHYDRKLLDIIDKAVSITKWHDRIIIFASRDHRTCNDAQKTYNKSNENLLFAEDINDLENKIIDP